MCHKDVLELRLRELKPKFILTDGERANRFAESAKRLKFVKEVFVIGDEKIEGCTPISQLLQDGGEGNNRKMSQ